MKTPTHPYKVLFLHEGRLTTGAAYKTRECAANSVSPLEGATVVGIVHGEVELFEPIMGMFFALQRANGPHAHLHAAFREGKRIQANHGTAAAPNWETLDDPQFSCPADEYRVHPEDVDA